MTRQESELLDRVAETAQNDVGAAVEMLESGRAEESSAALDFTLGNLRLQQDNLEAAARAYKEALAKLPHFRGALLNLGRVRMLQNRLGAAVEQFRTLAATGQADAKVLRVLGHALLQQGHAASAEAAYRQSLLFASRDAETRRGLAAALMRQERHREALAFVEELLTGNPVDRQLWAYRVNAYLAREQNDAAARAIEQAIRLDCADPQLIATLGDLYLNRNQPTDALRAYEAAFQKTAPAADRVLHALEGFLMVRDAGGTRRMIRLAEKRLETSAEDVRPSLRTRFLRLKGRFAQLQENDREAETLYREVLRRDPLDGKTLLLLAELLQNMGRLDDAVAACKRAARIDGLASEALVRQAQVEVDRENYAEAAPLLEKAQSIEPRPHVSRYLDQVKAAARPAR